MKETLADNHTIGFRTIIERDNKQIEDIIRKAMTEFNADPHTTIIGDPALKSMYRNFQKPRSVYFIAELDGQVVGGCGVSSLDGGNENTCELQRMFLVREARGMGIGKKLLELCVNKAKEFKFQEIYLETLSDMHIAIRLYKSFGFEKQSAPLGNTGHSGCNIYMIRKI
jgi:putative acetyltransferase